MPQPIRRNLTPAEWQALQAQGRQGMTPAVGPMSLADLVMEPVGQFAESALGGTTIGALISRK